MKQIYLGLCFLLAMNGSVDCAREPAVVAKVEIDRYMGKWYEIARLPNRFQKKCIANVTANYELQKNGNIVVINKCLLKDNEINTAKGKAWSTNSENSKLKVSFVPLFKNLKLLGGKYWIFALADDYTYALVGSPNFKYLWILSRKPQLASATYEKLIKKAQDLGFDTSEIIKTSHTDKLMKKK